MKYFIQTTKEVIDSESEIYYSIWTDYSNVKYPHCHDFYEVCLLINGKQLYECNESNTILPEGALLFTRPKDIHAKKFLSCGKTIVIGFPEKTLIALFDYLGEGFRLSELIDSESSPIIILSKTEKRLIANYLEELTEINILDKKRQGTKLRIILLDLLMKFFTNNNNSSLNKCPPWFAELIHEMGKKKNFLQGVQRMIALTGISHEHICRLMKEFLNLTPTEYINELKLNYSINLLLHTDMDILSISMEAGFGNLSHYYKIFKKMYHTPPREFRKQHRVDAFFNR